MFNRLAAGLLAGASLAAFAAPGVEARTKRPVRWNTGGAVWTTKSKAFKTFFKSGEITDRALLEGINKSGWTAEEIQEGMTKTYTVDVVGVTRFLYSKDGVAFLKDQTESYFPYWRKKKTAVVALRSAIIADSVDGKISVYGIMKNLPVDFRLADNGKTDGSQNVCAPDKVSGEQATSLLSWYAFLPACVQANSALPEPAARASQPYVAPARPLW